MTSDWCDLLKEKWTFQACQLFTATCTSPDEPLSHADVESAWSEDTFQQRNSSHKRKLSTSSFPIPAQIWVGSTLTQRSTAKNDNIPSSTPVLVVTEVNTSGKTYNLCVHVGEQVNTQRLVKYNQRTRTVPPDFRLFSFIFSLLCLCVSASLYHSLYRLGIFHMHVRHAHTDTTAYKVPIKKLADLTISDLKWHFKFIMCKF